MHLASPQSAILSAIVFNALIIVVLIPLALRGVGPGGQRCPPVAAQPVDLRLGGIVVPFAGIKLIDLLLNALHLV